MSEEKQADTHKRKQESRSDETRLRVALLRSEGHTYKEIATATQLPEGTIKTIIRTAQLTGTTHKKHKGGNHKAVWGDDVRKLVCDMQAAVPAARLLDLQHAVDICLPVTPPCVNTIWRMLQTADFTTKKLYPIPEARNSDRVKQERKEWVESVADSLTADNTVFIDESPFSFTITRTRGRSKKGTQAVSNVPAVRGKNHTLIAALSPAHGLLHWSVHVTQPSEEFISRRKGSKKKKTGPKGVTRDIFRSFILTLLDLPLFHSANDSISAPTAAAASAPAASPQQFKLVMDNARIHKGDITDVIFSTGHVSQPLPPYSPALNPIEYAFSKMKLAFRTFSHETEEEVDQAIKQAAATITPTDSMHWFQHTQSLYSKCVDLEGL